MELLAIDGVEEVQLPDNWQPIETTLGSAGVTEVPLPDGLGFGGADVWSGRSLDGTLYAVLCVERADPNKKFGTYAFRRFADGRREWVQLLEFTEGRVTVGPERGVAILTWLSPNSRAVRYGQLPGYVSPDAGGVATPITVVATAAESGGGGGVDQTARNDATRARKDNEAQAKQISDLTGRVGKLEARVSDTSLMHVVWSVMQSKLEDGLYLILSSNKGGVVGQVARIAAETAKAMRGRGEL